MIIKINNTIYIYGDNTFGQLGTNNYKYYNNITPCHEFDSQNVRLYNDYYSNLLICNEKIYYWGKNSDNIMVNNDYNHVTSPQLIDIGIFGHDIIYAIVANGNYIFYTNSGIYVMGNNKHYNLGTGSMTNIKIPVKLDLNIEIKAICIGSNSTYILSNNNKLYVCGDNSRGQLGINSKNKYISEFEFASIYNKEGVKQVFAGSNFAFVQLLNNKVNSFGDNSQFQLGLGIRAKFAMSNIPREMEFFNKNKSYLQNICINNNTCLALMANGKVYGWGMNYNGCLQTCYITINFPKELPFFKSNHVKDIYCAGAGFAATIDSGKFCTWDSQKDPIIHNVNGVIRVINDIDKVFLETENSIICCDPENNYSPAIYME